MHLTPRIQRAINISAKQHLGQIRKGDGFPYITHPFGVAWILSNYTNDEDVIIAGLFHDVLEDVAGYDYSDLAADFGVRVADIVLEVTEDTDPRTKTDESERASWESRKAEYIRNMSEATNEAMMVAAADKIHNLLSIEEAFTNHGDAIWDKFNSPIEKRLWFYKEVLNILKQRLASPIVDELEQVYMQVADVTGKG